MGAVYYFEYLANILIFVNSRCWKRCSGGEIKEQMDGHKKRFDC